MVEGLPEFFVETFPDLPFCAATSKPAMQWDRGRVWASGAFTYRRKRSMRVAVAFAQHAELTRALGWSVAAWKMIQDAIGGMWPREFLKEGKTEADYVAADLTDPKTWLVPSACCWPEGMSVRITEKFRASLAAFGVEQGTTDWLTACHAANKAVRVYQKQVDIGGQPFTYANLDASGGVTIRIAAGAVHRAPVALKNDLLDFGPFGLVKPLEAVPDEAANAAYVEMAHWDRSWRARFVTTEARAERPPKEPKEILRKPPSKAEMRRPIIVETPPPQILVDEPPWIGSVFGSDLRCDLVNGRIVDPRLLNPIEAAEHVKWRKWREAHGKPVYKEA